MTGDPHDRQHERDLARLIEATSVDDLARVRIIARVRGEIERIRRIDAAAPAATAPPPGGAARIRARLAARGPRRRWGWLGATALVAAAAVALAVGLSVRAGLPEHVGEVQMSIQGESRVSGTRRAPVVELTDGRFHAEVTPNGRTRLQVRTEEATVTVIGTIFSVERDRFATDVAVTRGTVEVRCAGRAAVRVHGGERHRCLPETAAGLLRRIVALGSADAAATREAIDAGLAMDAPRPVRAELLAHDVRQRAAAGDPAALDAAEAYLATAEAVRRAEMLAFVAGERFRREGCGAVDALERAVAEDPRSVLAVALASCVAGEDPGRARGLLDGVVDPGAWEALSDDVRARLAP